MRKATLLFYVLIFLISCSRVVYGQSSVFTDLKNDRKRAIDYFEKGNYPRALSILEELEKKGATDPELHLLMGKAYLSTNRPGKAALYYSKYEDSNPDIDDEMILRLAEIYAQSGNYQKAIDKYNKYIESYPDDVDIKAKIWRLNNIKYLYEDSAYYEISMVPINTSFNESGATFFEDGIVFLSDRPEFGGIKKLDRSTHLPFTQWYYCTVTYDTTSDKINYGQPQQFGRELDIKFNKGNLNFYNNNKCMIFSANSKNPSNNGILTLNLIFASVKKGKWQLGDSFKFNNPNYSFTQVFMSENQDKLYFSSDMPGGFGGMDLYYSEKEQDGWSDPVNMGEEINTPKNEGHPFLHNNVLYFSSDGHEGFGGLDIYKIYLNNRFFTEVENPGYPLNSNFDDFGLVLNKDGNKGFFTSNRNESNNDDIFAVNILLQTFPLTVEGNIKLKDPSSNIDSLTSLPDADLALIDKRRNIEVFHSVTGPDGKFCVTIPYHSQYQLKITKSELGSVVVSFELSIETNLDSGYEIVVVKELFQYDIE